MKRLTILLITILLVITGWLSGCDEDTNENEIDISKLELVNYTVNTRLDLLGEEFKEIKGFVKNNAGKDVEQVNITASFYNDNNTFIISKKTYIFNLANKDTKEFQVIYHSANNYYYQVDWDNIEIEITV